MNTSRPAIYKREKLDLMLHNDFPQFRGDMDKILKSILIHGLNQSRYHTDKYHPSREDTIGWFNFMYDLGLGDLLAYWLLIQDHSFRLTRRMLFGNIAYSERPYNSHAMKIIFT